MSKGGGIDFVVKDERGLEFLLVEWSMDLKIFRMCWFYISNFNKVSGFFFFGWVGGVLGFYV